MKKYLLIIYLIISCFSFGQKTKESKNIQVTDTNETYSFKANFSANKTTEIKQLIINQFGDPKSNDTDLIWNWNGSYEVNLRDGAVMINFGKSNDNNDLYQKVKSLGNKITSALK